MKAGLLFSENEVEILKRKVKYDSLRRTWESVYTDANDLLNSFTEEKAAEEMKKSFSVHYGKVIEAAFAYVITGDRKFADLARRICKFLLDRPFLKPPGGKPIDAELCLSEYSREIAIAYDWIFDTLTDKDKKWILDTLIRKAVENPSKDFEFSDDKGARLLLRVVSTFSTPESFDTFHAEGSRNNWDANLSSALGVIGLLAGQSEWVKIAENSTKMYLEEMMDEDGCCKEGFDYYNCVVDSLILLEAFKNILKKNLYTWNLLKTPNWVVNLLSPRWGGIVSFHDSGYSGYDRKGKVPSNPDLTYWGSPGVMFKLASEGRNVWAQWFGEQILEIMTAKKSQWDRQDAVLSLIWYDPTVKPVAPRGPMYRFYRRSGWVVLRNGWSKDGVLFVFRSGPPTGAHTHLDNNSFVLEAFEERLVIDTGYGSYTDPNYVAWDKSTLSHNTLLVDGQGQKSWRRYRAPDGQMKGFEREAPVYRERDASQNQMKGIKKEMLIDEPIIYGGKIFNYREKEHYVNFIGDATDCYEGLERYYRHVTYVKSGYLAIADDVIARENSQFEWRLFSNNTDEKGNIDVKKDLITLSRPKAKLLIKVLSPKSFRHRIGQGRLMGVENRANYISISPEEKKNKETLFMVLLPVRKGDPEPKLLPYEGFGIFVQTKRERNLIEYKPEVGIRFEREEN
jgi:hypothetical protein